MRISRDWWTKSLLCCPSQTFGTTRRKSGNQAYMALLGSGTAIAWRKFSENKTLNDSLQLLDSIFSLYIAYKTFTTKLSSGYRKIKEKNDTPKKFPEIFFKKIAPPPSANFLMMVSGNFFWEPLGIFYSEKKNFLDPKLQQNVNQIYLMMFIWSFYTL